jgi:hypothetical protein
MEKYREKFDLLGSGLKIPHSEFLDLPKLCRTIN